MRKSTIASTLFLLASVLCSNSFASGGGMEGGGGVGVRCGNKLELLDLHEARLSGLAPLPQPTTDDEAIDLIAGRMANHFYWYDWDSWVPDKKLSYKQKTVEPMYKGETFFHSIQTDSNGDYWGIYGTVEYVDFLPLSKDIGTYKIAPGCKLEQIAYFTDVDISAGINPKLEIVKSSWDQLDLLSRAVLIAHETLYVFDRKSNLRSLQKTWHPLTSEWTRGFVGALFSSEGTPPLMSGVPLRPKLRTECKSYSLDKEKTYTDFVGVPEDKGFEAVFASLFDVTDLYQFKAEFQGSDLTKFADFFDGEGVAEGKIVYGGSFNDTKLSVKITKKQDQKPLLILFEETSSGLRELKRTQLSCSSYEP